MKYSGEKGAFTQYFTKQLKFSLDGRTVENITKFTFILPGNSRYPYTDTNYLYKELLESFNICFPLGVKILYIIPNPNDDHYIEVGISIQN